MTSFEIRQRWPTHCALTDVCSFVSQRVPFVESHPSGTQVHWSEDGGGFPAPMSRSPAEQGCDGEPRRHMSVHLLQKVPFFIFVLFECRIKIPRPRPLMSAESRCVCAAVIVTCLYEEMIRTSERVYRAHWEHWLTAIRAVCLLKITACFLNDGVSTVARRHLGTKVTFDDWE